MPWFHSTLGRWFNTGRPRLSPVVDRMGMGPVVAVVSSRLLIASLPLRLFFWVDSPPFCPLKHKHQRSQ